MALKSCNEIGSAKTLLMFMLDLQKVSGSRVPQASDIKRIRSDSNFQRFLNSIIVCTEQDYSQAELEDLARKEHKLEYRDKYIELLSDIIKQLLRENKLQKLQTFGYSLEKGSELRENAHEGSMLGREEPNPEVIKCNFINLNKQCMITRNWETVYKILGDVLFSHLYKEYIIFLKTRDDSLVQVSGTNIFVYLNDKLGRLNQAFYDEKRVKTAPDDKGNKENPEGENNILGF